MTLVNQDQLSKIDRLKNQIDKGGLDRCISNLFGTMRKWSSKQTTLFDSDNRKNIKDVSKNYKNALDYASQNFNSETTFLLLQDIAGLVEPIQKVKGQKYAEFRNINASLKYLDYIAPLGQEKIRTELDKIIKFTKKELLHPIEESSFLYFHLIRIQPFENGNKRIASIIQNTILDSEGYPAIAVEPKENNIFLSLLKNAIDGYRKDTSQGQTEIVSAEIGYEQKAFFDYMTSKVEKQLQSIQCSLSGLDKYTIEFKRLKERGIIFSTKKRIGNYLTKENHTPHQVRIDGNKLNIAGNITYETIQKIMQDSPNGVKYTIKNKN